MKSATLHTRAIIPAVIVMGILACLFSTPGRAAKITQIQKDWHQTVFIGRVDSVSPAGDYLFVGERRVVLVDLTYQGKHYLTNIFDSSGNTISFNRITKDSWIFVRGGALPNLSVGARDIYLLPHELSETQAKRYPALWLIQPWEHGTR